MLVVVGYSMVGGGFTKTNSASNHPCCAVAYQVVVVRTNASNSHNVCIWPMLMNPTTRQPNGHGASQHCNCMAAFRLLEEKHNARQWANIWKGPPRVLLCESNVQDIDGKLHCMAIDTARNMLWVAPD